ncbi:TetR family transcriptional regulator [Niallia circulans]|jgi:AcrR family transcriptional regulator|uniref:TetR/AcrR family transcriptional regulator n=1 Tax=Niallia circulans TaxID=1397 RepID=UPI0002FC9B7F|nr:TetR-like C-terminal domain-containing protein [Niallia circulans]AYV68055.1 TetR family transcriptional regulator [Niallia circulans]AYV73567.1 TetR family transcriptional regulator [Niallia circulans]QJX63958.1 TetR/AcrR family transcriptional regulator [Niallia circulans]
MTPRAGITHNDIIVTAIEIANTEGLKEVTIANLAKRLRVKSPSLYNHIKGLPDIMNLLTLRALESLYQLLKKAIMEGGKEETIHNLSFAYLTYAREQPGLYMLTIESASKKGEEIQTAANQIIQLLIEVLKPYDLNEEETIHAIRGLRSILHGFASIENQQGFGMPIEVDKSFHYLVSTFIEGLEKHS